MTRQIALVCSLFVLAFLTIPGVLFGSDRCRVTFEALGVSGTAREIAVSLAKLHRTIDEQSDKALQGILREDFEKKIVQLHEGLATAGLTIDLSQLRHVITEGGFEAEESHVDTANKKSPDVMIPPIQVGKARETRLGNFVNRHSAKAGQGWEEVMGGIPTKLIKQSEEDITFPTDSSPLVLPDESIVIATLNRHLYRFRIDSSGKLVKIGEVSFGEKGRGSQIFSTPVLLPNGDFLVSAVDGYLYHFQALPDGRLVERSKVQTEDAMQATPLVLPDGTILVGDNDGVFYQFELDETAKLREKSRLALGAKVGSSPLALKGGVIVGTNNILRYLKQDREGKWHELDQKPMKSYLEDATAVTEETFVVGSSDGSLYHLKVDASGKLVELGQGQTGDMISTAPLVLSDKSILVGSNDQHVYHFGIDPTGQLEILGKAPTEGVIQTSAAELPNGDIVIGTHDHHLYMFRIDPKGQLILLDKGETGERIRSSPTVLSNRRVVVGSLDKKLHLFEVAPKEE